MKQEAGKVTSIIPLDYPRPAAVSQRVRASVERGSRRTATHEERGSRRGAFSKSRTPAESRAGRDLMDVTLPASTWHAGASLIRAIFHDVSGF